MAGLCAVALVLARVLYLPIPLTPIGLVVVLTVCLLGYCVANLRLGPGTSAPQDEDAAPPSR